jgi:hypothetical protein
MPMPTQPVHPSQRITAIFLLSLLLLQSCYPGPINIPQAPKPKNDQNVSRESYAPEGIEDLHWSQPKEGSAAVSEEALPNTQALVLATEPRPLSSVTPDTNHQIKSNEAPKRTAVRGQQLEHNRSNFAKNRTKVEHNLPSLINHTPGLPLNTEPTANQNSKFRKASKAKRTAARDQELAHRQKRAAQNRTNFGHTLSTNKIDDANVLNRPLNWKSREGHTLLELYVSQGLFRAKVADKASPQLTYDLPVTVFPGISLTELASYPAIKIRQYLHIQVSKTPAVGQVILSQGGLSGGGKNDKKEKPAKEESEEEEGSDQESKEEIKGSEQASEIAIGSLSPMALTTLWHMGQTMGEEHYLTTALNRLEEQANQGDGIASYRLIKKLSSLGNLAEFEAKQIKVLPLSWQNKSVEEVEKLVTHYYANAIAQLSTAQSELSGSELPANKLRILKLNYAYYELLGPAEASSKALLSSINKELDQLTLQKMPESVSLKRIYLSYLVKTAGQLDLQNSAEDLRTYIEYINDQIAQKAKDALKIEKKKGEHESLRRLAVSQYRKLGDLSARFEHHRSSNIGKSDEWQHSYYLQASKLQDAVGTYRLGLLYEKNGGSYQNQHKARQAFEKSAQQGYCLAEHKLALYHEKEGNRELARAWHERAAKQGHPESLYALYKQDSQKELINQEKNYLGQAAQAGHREAQYALGKHYWEQGQYREAIKWHEEAACQGIQQSCAYLGLASAKGLGTKQDSSVALDYYLRAEKIGDNAMARYGRARLYEKGKGVGRNLEAALKLHTEASLLDHAKAAYHAGRLHLVGTIPGSEVKQAYQFLEQGAKGGVYKASLLLGRMYEYGWGGEVDLGLALHWYKQAASNENKNNYTRAQALYQLGWLYRLGKGVDTDEQAALGYFEQAAILGGDKYVQLQAENEGLVKQLQGFQEKLEQSAEEIGEIERAYKRLEEESKDKLVQQEADFKKLQEEAKLAQETAYKKVQEEEKVAQEAAYKKLKEKSKAKLVQQEADFKKQQEEAKLAQEADLKKLKEEKVVQETAYEKVQTAYKKLQEESKTKLTQQEANFKKQQEETLTQEKIRWIVEVIQAGGKAMLDKVIKALAPHEEVKIIGEVIQKVAGDQAKLDNVIKALVPHGEAIVKALANNSTKFWLEGDSFTETDMAVLVNHPRFKQLININLNSRKISDASLKSLAAHLQGLTNLQELYLTSNQIGAVGMQSLAAHLQGLTNLQSLQLENNQIGDVGMQSLAAHLQGLTNLEYLNLDNNQIGDVGMQSLAAHLQGLTNLQGLYLDNNQIGDVGMQSLAAHLQGLTNLQILYLQNNQIGAVEMQS